MTANTGLRKIGQIAIQVRIHRAGNVSRRVVTLPALDIGKFETAIDYQHIARVQLAQLRRGNQRRIFHFTASNRRTRLSNIAAVAPQMFFSPNWNSKISRGRPRYSMRRRRKLFSSMKNASGTSKTAATSRGSGTAMYDEAISATTGVTLNPLTVSKQSR